MAEKKPPRGELGCQGQVHATPLGSLRRVEERQRKPVEADGNNWGGELQRERTITKEAPEHWSKVRGLRLFVVRGRGSTTALVRKKILKSEKTKTVPRR